MLSTILSGALLLQAPTKNDHSRGRIGLDVQEWEGGASVIPSSFSRMTDAAEGMIQPKTESSPSLPRRNVDLVPNCEFC